MNSPRSLLNRAHAAARLSAGAIAMLGLLVACATDLPPEDDSGGAGKGIAGSVATAGKSGKAGAVGMDDGGAPDHGEAGEGPASGGGGMQSGGSGGSAGLTGSQAGNGGGVAVCGNNVLEAGEDCDDGNTADWDGCSHDCKNKCEQCEKKYCLADDPAGTRQGFFLDCFTAMGPVSNPASGLDKVEAGPAMGLPKHQVCADLVACIRRTNCVQDGKGTIGKGCFCGTASTADCNDSKIGGNGPCLNEVAAAAESSLFADISQREGNARFAIGMANKVALQCDTDVCPAECMGNKNISACERCTFGDSTFGQDYGTGGAYYHCYFQSEASCTATSSPSSSSCPVATCAPAADCALSTHCAENGVADCYGTDGHGKCAAEFAAATGSTDPATVLDRLNNGGDYASSVLVELVGSEITDDCKSDCFPGSSGGSAGTGAGGSAGTAAGSGGASAGSGGANAGMGG